MNLCMFICMISAHFQALSSHLYESWFLTITMVIGTWRLQGLGFQLFLNWHVHKTDDLIPPSSFSSHLPEFIWQNFIPPQRDPLGGEVLGLRTYREVSRDVGTGGHSGHVPQRFFNKQRSALFTFRTCPLPLKDKRALEVSCPQVWHAFYVPE